MTVIEHFWFYGRLRGRSIRHVEKEAEEMVESLGLKEKRNALATSLSGGMKRKLSVATAFVGNRLRSIFAYKVEILLYIVLQGT